jgi:hypothetical protein
MSKNAHRNELAVVSSYRLVLDIEEIALTHKILLALQCTDSISIIKCCFLSTENFLPTKPRQNHSYQHTPRVNETFLSASPYPFGHKLRRLAQQRSRACGMPRGPHVTLNSQQNQHQIENQGERKECGVTSKEFQKNWPPLDSRDAGSGEHLPSIAQLRQHSATNPDTTIPDLEKTKK